MQKTPIGWLSALAAALVWAGCDRDPPDVVDAPADAAARLPADAGVIDAADAGEQAASHAEIYGGRLLGANRVGPERVEFSVFAPNAERVAVIGAFNDWDADAAPMTMDEHGIWHAELDIAAPVGQPYRFLIDDVPVPDLYAKANMGNQGDSLIADPAPAADWQRPPRDALVIYEMHASDFTYDPSSGIDAARRGRFAGLEPMIPYLERLGVNAVELMPVTESQSQGYTWGYNPSLLFAPETSFSQHDHGSQIEELQGAIAALQRAGIAVIVDKVYNHVSGRDDINHFWAIDPLYYFDYSDDGDPSNDVTPWGYRLATWRPMVKKLMYDNMKYWMDVYGVDGFRIDATEYVHLDSLLEVVARLVEDGYGERYYIFEEFDDDRNARIRAFNADAGQVLISSWGGAFRHAVWGAINEGAHNRRSLGEATFYSRDFGWNHPAEVINYLSSHDEGTLTARFGASRAQVKVSAVHLFTAMGVPMFWMGEEFRRLHYGNYHPDGTWAGLARESNVVDWTRAQEHGELVDFFAALIRLRVAHPALRLTEPLPAGTHFTWHTADWHSAIGYGYHGVSGDHDFVVLVNYRAEATAFEVRFSRPGAWHLMSDGRRATAQAPGLETWEIDDAPREIVVPAHSGLVFMSAQANP
jgi:pullulanase/glycogen debranching enzyme